tara:strand:+ start:503 stop:1489 length:987 start_codon:yes stop_codon:yes gene_type:complete
MADYKGIQGRSVQSLSTDPGTVENVLGQLWYNTTTGTYKLATENALSTGAWSSAPNLNVARYYFNGAGSVTEGIVCAGSPNYYYVEEFDGTSWTEVNDVSNQKGYAGVNGTQTACMICGTGAPSPASYFYTETYDGTSWTEVNNLNNGRSNAGPSAGPTSAGVIMGGTPTPTVAGATETWDGTCWTETGHLLTTNTQGRAGFGTQTACISVGGESTYTESETYNGSTWTEGNELNTGRGNFSGSGVTTAAIVAAGGPYPVGNYSETYDGTSWSAAPTTAQSHGSAACMGSVGSGISGAFVAGGYAPGHVNHVDHWSYTQYEAKTVTVS